MALEYRLILAGDTPAGEVATRVVADPADRPVAETPGSVLGKNLIDRFGYDLTVRSGRLGYYEAYGDSDDELWEWEPGANVGVTFRFDKDLDRRDVIVRNMLEAVARLLATGDEDAALLFNGDLLLLTRTGGVVRKHRRTWWTSYDGADEIIPG